MKPFLSLLLLLLTIPSFSQEDLTFLSEENTWRMHVSHLIGSWSRDLEFDFVSDTIVEGKDCKDVIYDTWLELILCEVDEKVYFKEKQSDQNLILLYDFSLKLNDTFHFPFFISYEDPFMTARATVIALDTIQTFDRKYRRKYTFDFIENVGQSLCLGNNTTWIEGIGCLSPPLLYPYNDCFEWSSRLECFTSDSTFVFGSCGVNSVEEKETLEIKIFPNPFKDRIFLESEIKVEKVTLFDISGKQHQLYNGENKDIILPSYLLSGLYILKLDLENGQTAFRKIIKE